MVLKEWSIIWMNNSNRRDSKTRGKKIIIRIKKIIKMKNYKVITNL